MEDGELEDTIGRAREGDLEAFAALVRRFQDLAVGYAVSLLGGDRHAAEDAAQEAFLETFRSLSQLREPRAFPGWFRRVVFKHCDRISRQRRPVPVPDVGELHADAPAPDGPETGRVRDVLLRALGRLPEHERATSVLFYVHDHSLREIADFLEIPVATVKTRLHAARARLRRDLDEALRASLAAASPSRDHRFEDRVMQLAYSAYLGDVERATELLERHPRLANAEFRWFWYWRWDGPGWKPLHRAAEQGHRALCERLIAAGADVNASHATTGWTPLHMAFAHGTGKHASDVAELLIDRGARLDAFAAAALGDLARLEYGDAHRRGPEGATALHYAGTLEAVEALLELGVDPSVRCTHNGATPVRWALAHGRAPEIATRLLHAGGEWSVPDAVAMGDVERVRHALAAEPSSIRWQAPPA